MVSSKKTLISIVQDEKISVWAKAKYEKELGVEQN